MPCQLMVLYKCLIINLDFCCRHKIDQVENLTILSSQGGVTSYFESWMTVAKASKELQLSTWMILNGSCYH